jgi:GNAT superfamily N-acetyltransferase
MFDRVGSPITQTFGLGLFAPASDDDLAALEAFFAERGAEVFHEVSPIADAALMPSLVARGYRPIELTSVMYRPVVLDGESGDRRPEAPRVRTVGDDDGATYAETAARGWSSEGEGFGDMVRDFATVIASANGTRTFLAELDGQAVAAAALAMHAGVAILAGASTVPAFRGRGAQAALLAARLRAAAAAGCDLAMMGALPGSASQRNAERAGFRIAYTRIKWTRSPATP